MILLEKDNPPTESPDHTMVSDPVDAAQADMFEEYLEANGEGDEPS